MKVRFWGTAADRIAVVAMTRGRPPIDADGFITDWLVWPSTLGHVRTKLRAAVLRRACRWQSAPLPPDEDRRLRALHALGVLDTEPEERFDRYTREACEALGVPIALVSMVDADRQWFKSRRGIDICETPRDQSLCAHAILGHDVFQVPICWTTPALRTARPSTRRGGCGSTRAYPWWCRTAAESARSASSTTARGLSTRRSSRRYGHWRRWWKPSSRQPA